MKTLRIYLLLMVVLTTSGACVYAQSTGCSDQGTWASEQLLIPDGSGQDAVGISAPLLLTDGRILVQVQSSFEHLNLSANQDFLALNPDNTGSYVNGTWANPGGSLTTIWNDGYAPSLFAAAVLADGKVIIEGGEYNFGTGSDPNMGAIYDPVSMSWAEVQPPNGGISPWNKIGDAPSSVLANGTFMLGACCNSDQVLLNESTLSWTATGTGKADSNGEEGWTLLPNGDVLTVDTGAVSGHPNNSEIYNPSTGNWTSAGNTGVRLYGLSADGSSEIGPAILRPNGTVLATGAYVSADGKAHTSNYNPSTGTWSAGPDFPVVAGIGLGMGDGPAVLLRDGRVLMSVSPYNSSSSSYYYESDGTTMCQITNVPSGLSGVWNSITNMVLLPTGQVFITTSGYNYYIYTPKDSNNFYSGAPTINPLTGTSIARGSTYKITGTQFNGLSQNSTYGDDFQNATNYPLVRISNDSTGHIFYAKTHDHSSMGVATGSTPTYTYFNVPSGMETGASHLVVVTNGFASNSLAVTVTP